MITSDLSHAHHYVPEWYQRGFLLPGSDKLHVLNLRPDTVKLANGKTFTHRMYRQLPPSRCFYSSDLYMLRFGKSVTDVVERQFFGIVDKRGAAAVKGFSKITGFNQSCLALRRDIPFYMGAQRFRTPRGLDWLKQRTGAISHNRTLAIMSRSFQQHTTMWAEGIWELVRACESKTKFIISDEPVSFYNARMPPSLSRYPGTEELSSVGTRTIFPLGPEVCLIITHLQFTRNPEQNPVALRINARNYDQVVMYSGNVQYGRELTEDEVIRLNLILKMKSTRYIAAGQQEWLYPEISTAARGWATLDDDWFLMPNLWKIDFTTQVVMGYKDGSAWASDEYGHHPGHAKFDSVDRVRRDREHLTRTLSQRKWAKLRRGRSLSQTYEARHNAFEDRMMFEYLETLRKKR